MQDRGTSLNQELTTNVIQGVLQVFASLYHRSYPVTSPLQHYKLPALVSWTNPLLHCYGTHIMGH